MCQFLRWSESYLSTMCGTYKPLKIDSVTVCFVVIATYGHLAYLLERSSQYSNLILYVFKIFTETILDFGSIAFISVFRVSCLNVARATRFRCQRLISDMMNHSRLDEHFNELEALIREAESCGHFAMMVDEAMKSFLCCSGWSVTGEALYYVILMSTLTSVALLERDWMLLGGAFIFGFFLLFLFSVGDDYSTQMTSLRDDLDRATHRITDARLSQQVVRLREQLEKFTYITIGRTYTLQRSSFVTVLNSLFGLVVIALQMGSSVILDPNAK